MSSEIILDLGPFRLVKFNASHITEKYVAWLNDKIVVRFSEQRHYKHSIDSCKDYYKSQVKNGNLFFAIETSVGSHIGNMGVVIDNYNKSADMSILIGEKDYWGKGVGLLMWSNLMKYLFEEKGLRLITAGTMSENFGMINLMRKSEMVFDAELPNRYLFQSREIGMIIASKINPFLTNE